MHLDMAYCYTLIVTSRIRYIDRLQPSLFFPRDGPRDPCFVNADDTGQVFVVWFNDVLTFDTIVLIILVPPRRTAIFIFIIVFVIIVFHVRVCRLVCSDGSCWSNP